MVRTRKPPAQQVISFRTTEKLRRLVERLAEKLESKHAEPWTMTDVLEEAIWHLARREGVK